MKYLVFASALVTAAVLAIASSDEFAGIPVKQPFGTAGKPSKTSSNQIVYHGGPVMNQGVTVYLIYYGTAFAPTTQGIVNDFLFGLSQSANYGVNTTYYGVPGTTYIQPAFTPPVATQSAVTAVYQDTGYSQGTQLGTNSIPKIIAHALNAGFPYDQNGVYIVITSPDVRIAGFCTSFCAYHTDTNVSITNNTSAHIRYALVPDPTQRCSACNGGVAVYADTTTPNGDLGADTMTDDIMHELSETVTDPDISAWYTQTGAENGDLCNYIYGSVQTGVNSDGAYHYNTVLPAINGGTRPYLIQQIWKNASTQACASQ